MTREEIIRNLKYTMEKHKNDAVNTFGTNISVMCKDILDYLEQEPCEDFISRKAVLDALNKWDWQELYLPAHFKDMIDDLPSIQPKAKSEVLDKIRAEIIAKRDNLDEYDEEEGLMYTAYEEILGIIDKYKAESEVVE